MRCRERSGYISSRSIAVDADDAVVRSVLKGFQAQTSGQDN